MNARNTVEKYTFSCLQRCRRQWSIFIRLAVVASEIYEILCKFELIQFKVIQVIDLGVNRKRIYNFLVINSNFGRKSYSFRDIDAYFKIACFRHPAVV